MHLCPDIESLFMSYLLCRVPGARTLAGLVDGALNFKFVPSGPLRKEDWPKENDPAAAGLEKKGFLFIDCGGGGTRFDQHGRAADGTGRQKSSIDLLAESLGDAVPAHLKPLIQLISDNDVSGTDITRDTGMRKSATPHTPRTLRNIILGWNIVYRGEWLNVVALSHALFLTMDKMAEGLNDQGKANELFLADRILAGLAKSCPERVRKELGFEVEQALQAMEKEWLKAEDCYWSKDTMLAAATYCYLREGYPVGKEIIVIDGVSDSRMFGKVCRRGNDFSRGQKPNDSKPVRAKADVVIQWYDERHFVVSTNKVLLHQVVADLRRADFEKKGAVLAEDDLTKLGEPGNLAVRDGSGNTVHGFYLADYLTACGNRFETNPTAPATALTRMEVHGIVLKALAKTPAK
jgi:hypothetical protein